MRKLGIFFFVAIVVLAACQRDAGDTSKLGSASQQKSPTASKRGPTSEELTVGMVEAVTVGKSTVPVAAKFELLQAPLVGRPLEVNIALLPQIAANSASLAASGGEGLQMATNNAPVEFTAVEPSQVYRLVLKVTPTEEGVRLLNFNVSLKHDDITETRVFSVPIIVAGRTAAAGTT